MTFHPYTVQHVVSSLELLLGAAAVFVLLRRALTPHRSLTLDTDWLYRAGGELVMRLARGPGRFVEEKVVGTAHESILSGILRLAPAVSAADRWVIDGAVDGVARGTGAIGTGLRRLQNGHLHRYLWIMAAGPGADAAGRPAATSRRSLPDPPAVPRPSWSSMSASCSPGWPRCGRPMTSCST